MLKRYELEKWLEGTGIVLLPKPSFAERIFEIIRLTSENRLVFWLFLFHLFSFGLLLLGILSI
jgi:hypothetical protein